MAKKKSALELDAEMTEDGMEYSSPKMKRSQARAKKAKKEEKIISDKNSKSLSRGIQGYVMGSNYMDTKDNKERNIRQAKRNVLAKSEEIGIKGTLKALKSKGELRG